MIGLRKRPLFALAALVGFVVSGVSEARGLEPCPHHDALPESLASVLAEADHHDGHGAASESVMYHEDGGDDSSSAHDTDHGACNCIGQCDASSSPSLQQSPQTTLRVASPTPVASVPAASAVFSRGSDSLWLFHQPTAPPLSV